MKWLFTFVLVVALFSCDSGRQEADNTQPLDELIVGKWIREHGVSLSYNIVEQRGHNSVALNSWSNNPQIETWTYLADGTGFLDDEYALRWSAEGDSQSGILTSQFQYDILGDLQWSDYSHELVTIVDNNTVVVVFLNYVPDMQLDDEEPGPDVVFLGQTTYKRVSE